jgi:hypothetical protein
MIVRTTSLNSFLRDLSSAAGGKREEVKDLIDFSSPFLAELVPAIDGVVTEHGP